MKNIRSAILSLALIGASSATSIGVVETASYTTASGYSQAVGSSSAYMPNPSQGTQINRYLYSAFQRGYADGNLQTNLVGGRYEFLPQMGVSHLRLDQPNYSEVEVWFQKDSRYTVQSAVLGILERQPDYQRGAIEISVNGRIVVATHAAWETHRFQESTWPIAAYLQDGLNSVKIRLERGGNYSLLGIKVETRETYGNGYDNGWVTDQQFIQNKFQQYLYRLPTSSELSFYVSQLTSGYKTRAQVEEMIRASGTGHQPVPDHYDQLVIEYFQRYAGRLPTEYEKQDYARRLRSNQLSLPEFRRILENMNHGGADFKLQAKIRNMFQQILRREPTMDELAHYTRRLKDGSLTWDQFQREVQYLGQGGNSALAFHEAEVNSMNLATIVLNSAFWQRLDNTPRPVLRVLFRKAQYSRLYGQSNQERGNAHAIANRIQTKFPQMQ